LEADIPYAGTDNSRQQLNLLLPKTPKDDRPLPVIAHIHGGAWLGGDRNGLRGVEATISEEKIPNQAP
jgi:acetyl esterase/lipase